MISLLQPELLQVIAMTDYKLILFYENNEKKLFDVSPYISGSWYGELQNIDYFQNVKIANHSVEWENGQDIAPHELYQNSIVFD